MRKKIRLYSAFGVVFALAIFEGFFAGLFDQTHGFNFARCIVAGAVGAIGCKLAQLVGRRLNAHEGDSTEWQFRLRQWFVPFLLVAVVPPLGGIGIGYLLRGTPLVAIGLMSSNVLLTPLVYGILTGRIANDRLAHVCFSVLLAWLVAMPVYVLTRQPLQLWFAAFPFSALLAIVGYLAAQGTAAIRSRAIVF
ncbi:hypothetical protein [Paraburkholderia diazotrophica]|uniref:hypothetical protein n=1 Tax=Paraburkholderia diazotrophica TaxID=667676 RepID=UPI003177E0B9